MSFVKCCFDVPPMPNFVETIVQKCTDTGCEFFKLFVYVFAKSGANPWLKIIWNVISDIY